MRVEGEVPAVRVRSGAFVRLRRTMPVGGPHRENCPAFLAGAFDGQEGGLHVQHSLVGEVRGPEATQRLFIH